jgi:membrane dipeptidase
MRLSGPPDAAEWAARLEVSIEACELLRDAHFIDLHCDLEVPVRLICYDPRKHHGHSDRPRHFIGQTDYPRIREAGFTGIVYDLATNPFRPKANRLKTTLASIERMKAQLAEFPEDLALVRSYSEYESAVKLGKTAFWLAIQGGNAVSADPSVLDGPLGYDLHRITLMHLTNSDLGGTSSPSGGDGGVSGLGREVVARCNERRIFVDLAHAGKKTFWSALEAHAVDRIPIVSHTGVEACRVHWRNVDDDQIRAIADRGGVIGVMYQGAFLVDSWHGLSYSRSAVLEHLQHICDVAGDGVAAIGTDLDGFVTMPRDLTDVTDHPLLVQDMLDRGWSEERIRGILGANYQRVVSEMRP